jgi:hypothetical protein
MNMKRTVTGSIVAIVVALGVVDVFRLAEPAGAQPPGSSDSSADDTTSTRIEDPSAPVQLQSFTPAEPVDVQTLDDLRKLSVGAKGTGTITLTDSTRSEAFLLSGFQYQELATISEAKQAVDGLRQELRAGKQDPAKLEEALSRALTTYFLADMKNRVTELDQIKRRVAKMEAQLERRMKAKEEIIKLQTQVIVREADGLGFFAPSEDEGDPLNDGKDPFYFYQGLSR